MRPELFDLNLLRALEALLKERNVSKAARRLHVTQQALSGSLRRLREHFNDELLVRVGRELRLSTLGSALLDPIRELNLGIIATLNTTSLFDSMRCERRFTMVMSDYVTLVLLPNLMQGLARTAPHVVCDVEPLHENMFEDLVAGKIDFCILPSDGCVFPRGSAPSNSVESLFLYDDDFVCVVDKDHPNIADSMSREQYLTASHNLLRLGSRAQSIVEFSWLAQGITPRVAATTHSLASLIWMVPGTLLISTAQRRLATQFRSSLPIRILECPVPITPIRAALQWHVRNNNDPAHRFMREAIVSAAAGA